MEDISVL